MPDLPSELSAVLRSSRSSFQPPELPPFAPLRRRARRRRAVRGGALLGVVALAGAGLLVFLPAGGEPDVLAEGAQEPASVTFRIEVDGDPVAVERAVDACLALPGTGSPVELRSSASYEPAPRTTVPVAEAGALDAVSVPVFGAGAVEAFRGCAAAVPGAAVSELPATLESTGLLVDAPTGAAVCRDSTCVLVGQPEAQALRDDLAGAPALPPDAAACPDPTPAKDFRTYRLTLRTDDDSSPPVVSADPCGAVRLGGDGRFALAPPADRAWASLPGLVTSMAGRCLESHEVGKDTSFVLGLTEDAASRAARERGDAFRVKKLDGRCLAGTRDLRGDRVNVVISAGRVVAAASY